MASGWDARIDRFQPNGSGIIEVWKSFEMQIALSEVTDSLCEQANDMGHIHGSTREPLYVSGVDVVDRTAIGYVRTNGLGAIDQAAHRTLDALNH